MRDRGGGGRGRGQDRYRDRYADVREDAAVPEYHDQLDGPVRSAAAAPEQLPDMYSDFPSLSGAPARAPASAAKKDEASEEFPSLGKSSKPQSWSNKSGAAANVEDFPSLPGGLVYHALFVICNVEIYLIQMLYRVSTCLRACTRQVLQETFTRSNQQAQVLQTPGKGGGLPQFANVRSQ